MNVHRCRVIMGWAFWSTKITGMFGSLPCQCVFISRLDLWMDICREEFFFFPLVPTDGGGVCMGKPLGVLRFCSLLRIHKLLHFSTPCYRVWEIVFTWSPPLVSNMTHPVDAENQSHAFYRHSSAQIPQNIHLPLSLLSRLHSSGNAALLRWEHSVYTGNSTFTYKLSDRGRAWSDVM